MIRPEDIDMIGVVVNRVTEKELKDWLLHIEFRLKNHDWRLYGGEVCFPVSQKQIPIHEDDLKYLEERCRQAGWRTRRVCKDPDLRRLYGIHSKSLLIWPPNRKIPSWKIWAISIILMISGISIGLLST